MTATRARLAGVAAAPPRRVLRTLGWFAAALCVAGGAAAEEKVSAASCGADVCAFNVVSAQLVVAPCEDASVLVAFSRSSGATLIECSTPGNVAENRSLVFDRRRPDSPPRLLSGGRFVRPEFIAEAAGAGVPDRFGPVPLCAAGQRRPAAAGELVIAEKRPNDSDDPPYCYGIVYAGVDGAGVTLQRDTGKPMAAASDSVGRRWAKLRQNLMPYIEKAASDAAASP